MLMVKKSKLVIPSMHGPWYPPSIVECVEWWLDGVLVGKMVGTIGIIYSRGSTQ